jgi:hypothetical protein
VERFIVVARGGRMGSTPFILYGPTFPILVHSGIFLHSIPFNLLDELRTSGFDIFESK